MARLRVGILFGGQSGEHEVSIRSAQTIAAALQQGDNLDKYVVIPVYIQRQGAWQGGSAAMAVLAAGLPPQTQTGGVPAGVAIAETPVDVWFPVLHGPNGEDGTVQGLLTLLGQPFVGAGVLASAAGMDKIAMKMLFAQAGLPQVKYIPVTRAQVWSNPCVFPALCDRLETELGYPCFVKPANLGSSVGMAKVRTRRELEAALDMAAGHDRRLIVEAGVTAREVECAVLGNDNPKASVVGEIVFSSDFYDYETKYTPGKADLVIPAALPESVSRDIRDMAIAAFQAIDGAGLARVDFFYVEDQGQILINEINTLPGFTATSMYPLLWQATGLAIEDLVDQLVQLALERARGTTVEHQ